MTSPNQTTPPTAMIFVPYIKNTYKVRLDQLNYKKGSNNCFSFRQSKRKGYEILMITARNQAMPLLHRLT